MYTVWRWSWSNVLLVEMFLEHEADTEASCDDDSPSSLDLLQSAFPHHSREELDELLMLYDGDVDAVFEMLASWCAVCFQWSCWFCCVNLCYINRLSALLYYMFNIKVPDLNREAKQASKQATHHMNVDESAMNLHTASICSSKYT